MKSIKIIIAGLLSAVGVNAQRVDFTNLTNQNTTLGVFNFVNQETNNVLPIGIVLGVFSVTFMGLKIYGTKQAFAPATFVTFFIAFMCWGLNWIPNWLFYICTAALALGIVALIIDKDG